MQQSIALVEFSRIMLFIKNFEYIAKKSKKPNISGYGIKSRFFKEPYLVQNKSPLGAKRFYFSDSLSNSVLQ
jgi:hypothetical protein